MVVATSRDFSRVLTSFILLASFKFGNNHLYFIVIVPNYYCQITKSDQLVCEGFVFSNIGAFASLHNVDPAHQTYVRSATHTHDVKHLFQCTGAPPNLDVTTLWTNPMEAARFLDLKTEDEVEQQHNLEPKHPVSFHTKYPLLTALLGHIYCYASDRNQHIFVNEGSHLNRDNQSIRL
jgi:hypothetical protein